MKQAIVSDLDKLVKITSQLVEIIKFQSRKPIETVAIFDVSNSTGMKLELGHDHTIKKMFLHNQLCRQIIKRFNGQIVKELGDGLLVRFQDPLNACLSAVNIQAATHMGEIPSKASLALGVIEEAKINNDVDIFGTTVDVCARIEKYAFPNQILIDRTLYDIVKSHLKDYDIKISESMQTELKGYEKHELYEISSEKFELLNKLKT
jgi:class 3 adenylate cyclase